VLAQLLVARGIDDPSIAREFLDPKLTGLRDPELLPGVVAACDLLLAAILRREQVVVYGDYDAD
jgi:single-stranded-DNA-specific exonuclease